MAGRLPRVLCLTRTQIACRRPRTARTRTAPAYTGTVRGSSRRSLGSSALARQSPVQEADGRDLDERLAGLHETVQTDPQSRQRAVYEHVTQTRDGSH